MEVTVIKVEEIFHEVDAFEDDDEAEDYYTYEVTYSLVDENNQTIEKEGAFSAVHPPRIGSKAKVAYSDGELLEYTHYAIGTLVFFFLFMVVTFVPLLLIFLLAIGVNFEQIKHLGVRLFFRVILTFILLSLSAILLYKVWLSLSGQEPMEMGWVIGFIILSLLFIGIVPSFFNAKTFAKIIDEEYVPEKNFKRRGKYIQNGEEIKSKFYWSSLYFKNVILKSTSSFKIDKDWTGYIIFYRDIPADTIFEFLLEKSVSGKVVYVSKSRGRIERKKMQTRIHFKLPIKESLNGNWSVMVKAKMKWINFKRLYYLNL